MSEREQSFRERKAAQLAAERGVTSEPERSAGDELEVEDVVDDVEDNAIDDELDVESDPDEGAADDDEAYEDDDEDEYPDVAQLKKERDELEKRLSRETENRKRREAEHAEAMAGFVKGRHELEDTITEAKRGAEYYANLARQQVAQFQNVN